MASMDFSQALSYSDIDDLYLPAVEVSSGNVVGYGNIKMNTAFENSAIGQYLINVVGVSEYDSTATYAVGDYCSHNSYLYQCITACNAISWDASYWSQVTIPSLLSALQNIIGTNTYDSTATYNVDDLCVYDGKLYKCTTAITTAESWTAAHWTETTLTSESARILQEIQDEGDRQVANVQSVLTDVNSELSQHDKRISNLESKSGSYVETSYEDAPSGVVPSGKLEYALVKKLTGVTRAWIQLVSDVIATTTISDVTFTNNGDGSLTISGTASADITNQAITTYLTFPRNSHYTLCMINASKEVTGVTYGVRGYSIDNANNFMFYQTTSSGWYNALGVTIASGTVVNVTIKPCVYDLTRMLPSDTPTTVADALARIPQLAQYNSYDEGSLVSTTYSEVVHKSRNVWDEEWEVGGLNDSTGEESTTTNTIRSTNFCECFGGQTYYLYCAGYTVVYWLKILWYDADKNFINRVWASGTTTVAPYNAKFFKIGTNNGTYIYGNTYNSDICINLSDANNGTYTAFSAPTTLTLPSAWTGRSAGTGDDMVSDVLDVETGVPTRNVGTYTFDGTESWSSLSSELYTTWSGRNLCKRPSSSSVKPNLNCPVLTTGKPQEIKDGTDTTSISIDTDGLLVVNISYDVSNLTGKTITYELATPYEDTTIGETIDNFLPTEAYGTITPKQTQTPQIDTAFTVGFMTA